MSEKFNDVYLPRYVLITGYDATRLSTTPHKSPSVNSAKAFAICVVLLAPGRMTSKVASVRRRSRYASALESSGGESNKMKS